MGRFGLGTIGRLLTLVLVAGGVAVLPATAVPAAEPCGESAQDASAARAMAKQCRRRVEVLTGRSETALVFANPSGTMTAEISLKAERVRAAGGQWVTADATLRRADDGTVRPVAAALPIVFSGGGTGPVARIGKGDKELVLDWTAALPAPVLDGPHATYPDVLPGVDLRLTADVEGFSEVLVVKTPAAAKHAALKRLTFKTRTKGLSLRTDAGTGAVSAVDGAGTVVFGGSTPTMWDSGVKAGTRRASTVNGGADPAEALPAKQRPMRTEITPGELAVVPDASLFTAADTVYPVYVDPTWPGGRNHWVMLWKQFGDTSYWDRTCVNCDTDESNSGVVRVGYQDFSGTTTARSVFEMDTSGLIGKQLKSATFSITQSWSGKSCGGTAGTAQLWQTSRISNGMTWNSAETGLQWLSKLSSNNQTRRFNGSGACAQGRVEWDAAGAVQAAINSGAPVTTVGLREAGESDPYAWRRYQLDPKLTVEYNSIPSAPDQFTVASTAQEPGLACVPGTVPVVRSTPVLRVRASDADDDSLLAVTFTRQKQWVSQTAATWVSVLPDVTVQNVPAGGTATLELPAPQTSGRYRVTAVVTDGNGAGATGPQSQLCEYIVDTDAPGTPAAVTSATYPEDGEFHGGRGVTGAFTVTPPTTNPGDVQKYVYALTPTTTPPVDGTRTLTANAVTHAVTIQATPSMGGLNTLRVWAVDAAGNLSAPGAPLQYQFKVDDPSMAAGQWHLDDPAGATTLTDSSGYERHGTIAGATTGAPGPMINGWTATGFSPGTPTFGATLPKPFSSTTSFSMATWAKLDGTGTAAIVGAGTRDRGLLNRSSFHLMYQGGSCGWAFRFTNTTGTLFQACAPVAAPANVWTHVAGVYDSGAQAITLYVDGIVRSTVAVTGTSDVAGDLNLGYTVGLFENVEKLSGQLSDLQVWDRKIFSDEVARLIGPPGGVPAAGWELDGDGTDIVGRSPLQQSAAVTYGPNRDGTPNAAAVYNGGSAYSVTSGPVLRTEQSYTVSAWVKLTNPGTSSRTVLSQGNTTGAAQPAFQLMFEVHCNGWTFGIHGSPAGGNRTDACAPAPPVLNTWTHLVAVHNASTHTMSLYIDGVLAVSQPAPATPFFANGPAVLGQATYGGVALDPFTGSIDEVALYPGALPAEAVVEL
ncbi:LamG-like jellyroll fold domain-containing protein [Dactylosporangium siamense]|nr:LamG-like jellyroll fold domain-containing protein [Dactylosporangium siamense]